jgi:hypothetical protein
MKLNKPMKTILPLAVIAGFAVTANAAVVITPTGATTTGGSIDATRVIGKTIDSSGLSGVGDILTQTHSVGVSGDLWLSANNNGSGVEFVFDLGGTHTVDSVHLWNISYTSGAVNRGLQTVDVTFSTDGGFNFNTLVEDSEYDDFGGFAMSSTTGPGVAETKTFTAVAGVTHIKFTDSTNHGATYTGIGEIRFGAAAVPEPSTTALLGLGGLALILRRRK